jgi:hypothetical protein
MAAGGTKNSIGAVPIALFLVLVAVGASISAVAWEEAPRGTPSYTIVDPSGILQVLLSSTVDEVSYTDIGGRTHVYTGWTVQELLIEDLELRFNSTMGANVTGLSAGIEAAMGKTLGSLSGGHHFNLEASFATAYLSVYDLDVQGSARATTLVHMRNTDANAKVTLAMTE